MKKEKYQDKRVKRKVFPLSAFISAYIVVALLATMHMQILQKYLDFRNIPVENAVAIFAIWIVAAVAITYLMNFYIYQRFQKPIEKVSEAARKVAGGNFNIEVTPDHAEKEATQIDVLIADFNRMVKELSSTEILKSDFISNVSHEFKAPLAVIRSNAEVLSQAQLNEKQRQNLQNITDAVDRLNTLVANLLRLNKLENQNIQPVREEFDLCGQLEECAVALESVWEKKNIDLKVELNYKCQIQSDSELLSLVWMNLLSNAAKFTPEGGQVTIKLAQTEKQATVIVADTGCGMDAETMAHIFDKFYQGDTSHATQGNGLGLTLVWRIVQMLDGRIKVESEPGKGSVFTVSLEKQRQRDS